MSGQTIEKVIDIKGNITDIDQKLNKVGKSIKDISASSNLKNSLESGFDKVGKSMEEVELKTKKAITSMTDMKSAENAAK